jgi:hexosaminidase
LVQPASYHYLTDPIPFRNEAIVPDSEANFDRFESEIIKKVKQGEKLITKEEEKLILGGEATMWTEHVSTETFDSRVWPRTAAIAERLWSPADVRDVEDMYRRLDGISVYLESLGLTHIKNRDMMLRRLSGKEDVTSFSNLVQLLEPVQGYKRNRADNFTRFSPYSLLADIAVPDQKAVRLAKKQLMKNDSSNDDLQMIELETLFNSWKKDAMQVELDIKNIPALKDFQPHANALAAIAELGLNAINFKKSRQSQQKFTAQQIEQILKKANQEAGYCELKIVEPFRAFVMSVLK